MWKNEIFFLEREIERTRAMPSLKSSSITINILQNEYHQSPTKLTSFKNDLQVNYYLIGN
jgi:hypothetical protein